MMHYFFQIINRAFNKYTAFGICFRILCCYSSYLIILFLRTFLLQDGLKSFLRSRTKAAAVFESQLESERRENLELQEEIYYLRRSLIQIDSRVEQSANSREEHEKDEKSEEVPEPQNETRDK